MNYQKYADKAHRKLKQYGSPITVKRSGKKVYDKTTNTYIDNGEEFSGVATQKNIDQKNIDGTNIKFGDVQFMCSLSGKPYTNDTIESEGKIYTVLNVVCLNPDGRTDIFYSIQAR